MRRPRLAVALLLLTLAGVRCGWGRTPDVLRLPWAGWSFHLGDDPRCAAIADPVCVWQAPDPRNPPLQVNLWQRIEVQLPESMRASQQLGLLIQGEWPVYEVFVNGQRIGASGSFATRRGPQDQRAIFALPAGLAPDGRLVVALHQLNLRTTLESNPFVPAVGPMERIEAVRDSDTLAHLHSDWLAYLCYFIILCIGLVFLVLFALDRQSKEYLWLGLNLFVLGCLRAGHLGSAVDLGISSTAAAALYISFNAPLVATIVEFSYALVRRRVSLFFRVVEVAGLLFGLQLLLLLPLPERLFHLLAPASAFFYRGYRVVLGVAALARLVPLRSCFGSRLGEMRWIGGALLFIAIEAESRHLTSMGLPGFPLMVKFRGVDFDLLALAYVIFAIVMLAAMSVRFRRIMLRSQMIEQELAAASAVQQLLLASSSAPGSCFNVETVYLPAGEVGGDFFHILPQEASEADGSLLIIVGDVSGKGLKAAMTVSAIVGALRGCRERRPAAVLGYLNRVLCGQITGFVTCCAVHLDAQGGIRLANAGNPPPYLSGEELAVSSGIPLGITPEAEYEETSGTLEVASQLVFVSDGVIEASQPVSREMFGFDRTQAISAQPAAAIAEAARSFGEGAPQADDITVLTVSRVALATVSA